MKSTPHAVLESEPHCQYTAFGVDDSAVCIYACMDVLVCVHIYAHVYVSL